MRLTSRQGRASRSSFGPVAFLTGSIKICVLFILLLYGVLILNIGGKVHISMEQFLHKLTTQRVLQAKRFKMRKSFKNKVNETKSLQYPYGGAFVHTGKTGGSTISVLLRNGCHSFMPHPCRTNITYESAASKLVKSYYHVPDFGSLRESNHSFYIITSRDPFDRTISAFVYDHVKNRYARNETISAWKQPKYEEAYQCFPTVQKYVEFLGNDPFNFNYPHKRNWVTAESCSDLAKAALHSRVKLYNHLYFSFRLILTYTPRLHQQKLYTIRQEYLWDDWKSVNIALGQVTPVHIPDNGMTRLRNVALLEQEKKVPVTRELNLEGRRLLCKALRDEYRAYYYLLTHANNLSNDDIQKSIERTKVNCPDLDLPYSKYVRVY